MLFFLDDFHPFFGSGFQLFKAQARSQSVGYPRYDVWRQQTEHSDFESVAIQYYIRSEIRLSRGFVDDIGGQNGHLDFWINAVEYFSTCFNVVIADAYGIVWEVIEHFRNEIRMLGILIGAILEYGALQIVAIIQENESFAQFRFHLLDDESVIGKFIITTMSVSRFQ